MKGLVVIALSLAASAAASPKGPPQRSTDPGVVMAVRFLRASFVERKLGAAEALLSPSFVHRTSLSSSSRGVKGFRRLTQQMQRGMSDPKLSIHYVVSAGQRVVVYWTLHFVHSGELLGMPATHRRIGMTGVGLFRISGGKIAELWEIVDRLRLLKALASLGSG